MDRTLRSILWILVGLVILSSFSTGWFFMAKEKLYNDYINLENLFKSSMEKLNNELIVSNKDRLELKAKLDEVEKELRISESERLGIKSKYEDALNERDSLNKELASVKMGRMFLEKKIKEMQSDIFVSGLLKEKVALEVELDRFRNLIAPKDSEINMLKAENMGMAARNYKLQEEKSILEQRYNDSMKVADILSRDLLKEKDSKKQGRQDFEKIIIENNALRSKVSGLENMAAEYNKLLAEKQEVNVKISRLESDLDFKNNELNKLKSALSQGSLGRTELRAEAYHDQNEVDLPPIVLNREPQKVAKLTTPALEHISPEDGLNGRIVTVNKEHNFVVIDLGRQDGVDVGSMFSVFRSGLFLGKIEVIQARDRIAAADIKEVKEGLTIEVNDIVIKR